MGGWSLEKKLKDDSTVTIREMSPDDELKVLNFFKSLPLEMRQYLRMDVTVIENLRKRIHQSSAQRMWRIVAEQDDKIRAEAMIFGPATGWQRHTCELRCIVHPDYQKKGLGSILLWELFQKTLNEKYDLLICEVVPEQVQAISVLDKLGFTLALKRPKHVRDISGEKHDLCIYTMNVKAMWDRLKQHYHTFDTEFGHHF
ncbi:MAG: GNAT family N-acetyltransferase [Planctomycetota bacterium]